MGVHLKNGRWTLLAACLACHPAWGLEFEFADTTISLDNLLTVGALWRTDDRDPSLIGKANLNPGLCVRRTSEPLGPRGSNDFAGDTCTVSNTAANQRAVDAPGAYSVNGDNGNLNFDKGDIAYATAKLTSELRGELYGWQAVVSGVYFFDSVYSDFESVHPDTTMRAARSRYSGEAEAAVGTDFDLLEYNLSRNFELAGHQMRLKVGNQILNWGESAFLLFNSLNNINPPDAIRLRVPGFDVKELLQPLGMVAVNANVIENVNVEAFYGYEWKPVILDPPGSFFSTVDVIGAGAEGLVAGSGKLPEDPDGLYRPVDNPDDSFGTLGSESSRTIYRDFAEEKRREPPGTGQYGLALKWFLPDFMNGTDLGFYYASYHSRLPVLSGFAGQRGCLQDAASATCGLGPAREEPFPLDTIRLLVEYPENVQMYGVSFNTTIGDYAWSGEYVFRPNLPIQIHVADLGFALLGPVLPDEDVNLGARTIPGRNTAVPDFLTEYRGRAPGSIQGGEYVPGFERMKSGQLGMTLLRTIGGKNWIKASQIILLLEMGFSHILDFPELDELQFQGGQGDLAVSAGADGTRGINPRSARSNPDDPATTRSPQTLRLNPHALDDLSTLGTEYAYGYRLATFSRYQDALFGVNLEGLLSLNHDVKGTAPGVGTGNFVEGRKQGQVGLRFDFLSTWLGEVRHTWYFGGGQRDNLRDRENLMVFLGYQF